ncbi:MAG: YgiQ family radical SAM protein, partial [Bacteroidota bacterium]
ADMLVYGMGEMPLREVIRLVLKGVPFESLKTIPQTAVLHPRKAPLPVNKNWEDFTLHSHERCLRDKKAFASNFKHIEQESNKVKARRLIQGVGDHNLIVNPPYPPMTEQQIDTSFDLPYTRLPHPKYKKRGSVPAYEMIRFSINMHRGCFGGCSFCTISAHQGKFIASRSEESILKEVDAVTKMPDFKGYISDLGGPSANMYKMKGKVQEICDRCVSPSCIHPVVCSNLDTSHKQMTELYRKVDEHPEVKKAYVGSGIRYDLLVDSYNKNNDGSLDEYMEQVVTRHVCGRLKVAPEHTSDATLKVMRKPSFKHFHEFKKKYDRINKKHGLKQPLIPYFISSHPGSEMEDMANLAAETKDMGFKLEQVQDFTPTPMTVATIIYYTGLHPYTLKSVFTAKSPKEKRQQHLFFFWHKRENYHQIKNKLTSLGREDLIEKLIDDKKRQTKRQVIKDRKFSKDKNRRGRKNRRR